MYEELSENMCSRVYTKQAVKEASSSKESLSGECYELNFGISLQTLDGKFEEKKRKMGLGYERSDFIWVGDMCWVIIRVDDLRISIEELGHEARH